MVDLDDPFGSVGCVIMASGMGRRFGGNKLMADFHGQPLLCRALEATEDLFSRRIVVTRHADVAALCRARGVEALVHDLPHRSDTVRLGLEAVGDMERCLFAAADQPLLRQETVAALALAAANEPEAIWRPVCGDVPGSPVIFPGWAFPALRSLPEGRGGSFVIKSHPQRLRVLSVRDGDELRDADTPEELAALASR